MVSVTLFSSPLQPKKRRLSRLPTLAKTSGPGALAQPSPIVQLMFLYEARARARASYRNNISIIGKPFWLDWNQEGFYLGLIRVKVGLGGRRGTARPARAARP